MLVSVCVPVYNVEKYIGRCLESLRIQTYTNLEIIVVDDCSPDNSIQVVEKFAQIDSRIKCIRHKTNLGLMMARKTGYTSATGEYVTFLDSDDYLPVDAIEKLLNAIVSTRADVVSGSIEYIAVDGHRDIWASKLEYGNGTEYVLKSLLKKEFRHNLCSKIFAKKLLQDYTYLTYNHCNNGEDGMLFYQIVNNCSTIIQIPDIVYYYCQNVESSSQVRLNESAVTSIIKFNKMRMEICLPYSKLYRILFNYISYTIIILLINRPISPQRIKAIVHENQLYEFMKISNILRYMSFTNYLKIFRFYIIRRILNRKNG